MSDTKAIVPYDPADHLVPWERRILGPRFMQSTGAMVAATAIGILMGCILGFMVSGTISIFMHETGYETHFMALWALIGIPTAITLFIWSGRDMIRDEDVTVVKGIRERVNEFVEEHLSDTPTKATLGIVLKDELVLQGSASRPLLLQIDAVLIHLDGALREIGPHETAIEEANEVAAKAIVEIVDRHRDNLASRHAEKDVMTRLKASVQTAVDGHVGDGSNLAPTAPTARIARIVTTAEKALSAYPDIVDGQGARVDDLIRKHVPRLLQRHADAARTASSQDVAAVDMALEQGVEDIRLSVEEALAKVHDEAMDALATELSFLTMRRGTAPALTAVG